MYVRHDVGRFALALPYVVGVHIADNFRIVESFVWGSYMGVADGNFVAVLVVAPRNVEPLFVVHGLVIALVDFVRL